MANQDNRQNPYYIASSKNVPQDECKGTLYPISQIPKDATVTMAYIPFQVCNTVYEDDTKALMIGTLFPELNKPFLGASRR